VNSPWWRDAVVYEVYVRSFADSDGDGEGDLEGIRTRLPYLADLGVDALWLTPFYTSPLADGGYDVADYRDVDPRFGDLEAFDRLVADAHAHGLRLIVDIVPNHTSIEHPWFRAGLRDRYLFRSGPGDAPPNDWQSNFGGPAWSRVADGSWYLHLFAPEQPDLNWRHPEVQREFDDILRFWLDRGVDGFRIDVAMGLFKQEDMPNVDRPWSRREGYVSGGPIWGRPEVHEVYRRWRHILDSYDGERMAIGEVWTDSIEDLGRYVRPDELHQVFNFMLQMAPWDASAFRAVVDEALSSARAHGTAPTWALSSHDAVRHRTRYASLARARAALLFVLALPGSAYLYQGEELGLPEVTDLPDELRQDPVWHRTGGALAGRDGCRVPIPWAGAIPPYGFSTGKPWLPMPEDWAGLSVEAQLDTPGSTLAFYREALRARRGIGGDLSWISDPDDQVLSFRRGDVVCMVNFGETTVPLPPGQVLLTSARSAGGPLRPNTAVWLRPA
jgi:alpha-glucosidase